MFRKRLLIHSIFLFLLPVVVAAYGFGVVTAALLVAGMLLWRWLIVMSSLWAPEKTADVVLETISASHFVEKVRWCLDRLGVSYTERQNAGTLGAFFMGPGCDPPPAGPPTPGMYESGAFGCRGCGFGRASWSR